MQVIILLVDVHLEIKGELTVNQSHDIVVNAHDRVLKQHAQIFKCDDTRRSCLI